MEFHGTRSAPISMTWAVPWNSMELWVRQFRWHEQFHGIPWNLKCANFADMRSSVEFHGTLGAPVSLTRAVPWNSMELRMRQFRWHEQFLGIPWNLECVNFADTSRSMEFHGTWSAPISLTWEILWNSMELWLRQFRWHEQFHGIPWNSMELRVRQFRWHEQFHGIPWNLNCSCQRNWRTQSSMEFHGIPWNCSCQRNWCILSSMEFHEIPWNCSCQRNWRTQSSMEFHGTSHVSEMGALQVPWNSMELLVSAKLAHSKFHGIPWNCSCQRKLRTQKSMELHGTSHVSEIGALQVP